MAIKRLGLVTIGQSPRVDVTADLAPIFSGIEVLEAGALDELDSDQIAQLAPLPGEQLLVSRLRDGTQAVLAESRLHDYVQAAVDRVVTRGADAVLVICTGHLAGVESTVPVYTAEVLARGGVATLVGHDSLAVVVPEPEQASVIGARWEQKLGRPVVLDHCDPYTAELVEFAGVADRLGARPVQWVFLDCIGYSEAMADVIRAHSGLRVLTARGIAARLAVAAL